MSAKIETTVCNGKLIAATEEIIQKRLENFANVQMHLKALDVSVDLDNPDKPTVQISTTIGEEEFIGTASAENVVQAVDGAILRLEERIQERGNQVLEQHSEPRDNSALTIGAGVVAVLLAGIVGFTILRIVYSASPDGPAMYTVKGKVTLDGNPVSHGFIAFRSAEATAQGMPSGGGEIIDGSYEFSAFPGTVSVLIFAPKEIGEPDVTAPKKTVETIPRRYNIDSELNATIEESDLNELNFQLQSGS